MIWVGSLRRIEYEYITSNQGIECMPVYVVCLYPVGWVFSVVFVIVLVIIF
jgi:hypothetical protein